MAETGEVIGSYEEYLHEQTSKFGMEIRISGSLDKIILWEELLFLGGKERQVRHVAYPKKSMWHKLRVKDMHPSRVALEDSVDRRTVILHFPLMIKDEIRIIFSVKL